MRKGVGRWFIKAIIACTAVSFLVAYFNWIGGIIFWVGCLATLANIYEHLEMEDRE
jgi:4-hydroxybenzoate polyprenyltransferase